MAIRLQCVECGKALSVKDELAGKRVKCPCGAVMSVPASAAANPAQPMRESPAARPAQPARPPQPARRPAPPTLPPAGPNPFTLGGGDLSDLFDELTPTDLQTRSQKADADAASAEKKVDPLAAYEVNQRGRKGRGGGGATAGTGGGGTTNKRPGGLTALAVLNFLIAAIVLVVGGIMLVSPETMSRRPGGQTVDPTAIRITGAILLASGAFALTVGVGLLRPQPWGWWLANAVYTQSLMGRLATAGFQIAYGNAAYGAGQATGALVIGLLILVFLYGANVRDYFGVKTKPMIAMAIVIPAALAFTVVTLVLQGMAIPVPPPQP